MGNSQTIKRDAIIEELLARYEDLVLRESWGETALFLNPNESLPRGKYFATFKEKDGENDAASHIDRDAVDFRLNLKISKETFLRLFNEPSLPVRPDKGGIISLKSGREYRPMELDEVMPHPVYGWMSWIAVTNPSESTFYRMLDQGLFNESYENAKKLLKGTV